MSQAAPLKRRSFFQWLAKHLYYWGNQVKRSTILRPPVVLWVQVGGFECVCEAWEKKRALAYTTFFHLIFASVLVYLSSLASLYPLIHHVMWRPFIFLSFLHLSVLPAFIHSAVRLSAARTSPVLCSKHRAWSYNHAVFYKRPDFVFQPSLD